MQQFIIKPWRRSLGPWCKKNDKNSKGLKKLEKVANIFFKIAEIKILKKIPLHLEAMR